MPTVKRKRHQASSSIIKHHQASSSIIKHHIACHGAFRVENETGIINPKK
jgi:hypothetical protein